MPKQDMLINYIAGEECRIAIVEKDKLEELYTERASDNLHVSNIYRGRVTNIEPSIQAAFIDFGLERNGFLHISDLHPQYFPGEDKETTERVGLKTPRKDRPPIQNCLKRGQEILVQVLKEGIGTKGPTLTSYLSIPGRFLVMMPHMEKLGVTRKVEDEQVRRDARKVLDQIDFPKDFGFILRTAGVGRNKTELKRDLAYLMRLWKEIDSQMKKGKGPRELYTESDLIIRTLRDVMTTDVKRVIVDDEIAAQQAKSFLRIAMPRTTTKVLYYNSTIPLFDSFDVEKQIRAINAREVPLPSGGSLVFDQTEALVAVDVNSGKFRDNSDSETTAFKTNQEAVEEICRQLRLRDLGGVVVLDLIDMYKHSHRRDIERLFRDHIKKDRARTKPLRINDIGLLTLTRQRMRPSLKRAHQQDCPTCDGSGAINTPETVANDTIRQLQLYLSNKQIMHIELMLSHDIAAVMFNRKRKLLQDLEQCTGKTIEILIERDCSIDYAKLVCFDSKRVSIKTESLSSPPKPNFTKEDEITETASLGKISEKLSEVQESNLPEETQEQPVDPSEDTPTKKRRRRRRRKAAAEALANNQANQTKPNDNKQSSEGSQNKQSSDAKQSQSPKQDDDNNKQADQTEPVKKQRRRRRRSKSKSSENTTPNNQQQPANQNDKPKPAQESKTDKPAADDAKPKKKKTTRRRKKSTTKKSATVKAESKPAADSKPVSDSSTNNSTNTESKSTTKKPISRRQSKVAPSPKKVTLSAGYKRGPRRDDD